MGAMASQLHARGSGQGARTCAWVHPAPPHCFTVCQVYQEGRLFKVHRWWLHDHRRKWLARVRFVSG